MAVLRKADDRVNVDLRYRLCSMSLADDKDDDTLPILEPTINSANDLLGIKGASTLKQHQFFLLSLIILVSGGEVLVTEKIAGNNDISPQAGTLFQAQPSVLEVLGGKKLGKRGLLPAAYVDTYTPVLPW
ncbi:hypothetical protein EAG_01676 [Camponotus floridanus]|uniref:Uncharacterized protein n=1 Tax=Camponotus floridanus TaxID=104421 RepID=E2AMJ1_CAMFO|nr:hypothetical protein EAG_01676 [Camponotus floridanus]